LLQAKRTIDAAGAPIQVLVFAAKLILFFCVFKRLCLKDINNNIGYILGQVCFYKLYT
jgi:hypothetical protein